MAEVQSSQQYAKLAKLVEEFVKAADLESRRELPEDSLTSSEIRTQLNTEFWRQVTSTTDDFVQSNLPKNYKTSEEAKLLISFGVIPIERLAESADRARGWLGQTQQDEFRVTWMHEGLADAYREIQQMRV